jgi:capsular polysaccharide biosynthesis protein
MSWKGALRSQGGRVFARVLRSRLLRGSGLRARRIGPPRTAAAADDLRGGCTSFPGTASYEPDWSGLRYDDGTAVRFSVPLPSTFAKRDVLLLPRGRVVSEHGWVVSAQDEVVLDTGFVHEEARFRYFETDARFRRLTKLAGDVLDLTSTWSNVNYGHALLDSVSRLAILRSAGISTDRFDWFVVPGYASPEVDFVLDRAGVPSERRIRADPSTNLRAERLWATGFPGTPRCYPRFVPEFLRSLLTAEEQRGDARIWLSRASGKRALANHPSAEALVRSHGYEPFVPRAGDNALLTLAKASSIVGPHGAALSSIAVCAPGTRVTEILPSGHRYPYFATLAASAGHEYRAIAGESVSDERDADFTVDLDRLDAALLRAAAR